MALKIIETVTNIYYGRDRPGNLFLVIWNLESVHCQFIPFHITVNEIMIVCYLYKKLYCGNYK